MDIFVDIWAEGSLKKTKENKKHEINTKSNEASKML